MNERCLRYPLCILNILEVDNSFPNCFHRTVSTVCFQIGSFYFVSGQLFVAQFLFLCSTFRFLHTHIHT